MPSSRIGFRALRTYKGIRRLRILNLLKSVELISLSYHRRDSLVYPGAYDYGF